MSDVQDGEGSGTKKLEPDPSQDTILGKMDRFITRMNIILSSHGGTDSVIRSVGYCMYFLSAGLEEAIQYILAGENDSARQAHWRVRRALADMLPAKDIPKLQRAQEKAAKLNDLVFETRRFMRIWGLLGMYAWAQQLVKKPPGDAILWCMAWGQCIVYTLWQMFDNRAYLSTKNLWIKTRSEPKIASDWRWSARMWMTGIGLDFIRLSREMILDREHQRMQRQGCGGSCGSQPEPKDARDTKKQKQRREVHRETAARMADGSWRRDFWTSVGYGPMTYHWSFEGGRINEKMVGFLGTAVSLLELRHRWKSTKDTVKP